MKTLHRFCALLVVAAAGCGGLSVPQPQSSSEMLRSIGAIHAISALTPARIVLPIHRTVGKSWIRPGAVKQWLLYASDFYEGVVDVYDYRSKKGDLEGQITGFTFPGPQCVDSSGNVYVTDGGTWNIYEFAHGATSPSQTVHDQYGNPNGCSVDPRTGDLAVANVNGNGGSYSPGGIVIFAGGIGGVQTNYTNNAISGVWPPGYDSRGNLFFEYSGNAGSGAGELPDGSNQIRILSGMKIGFPGAVQWDGSRVAMSDQEYEGRNYEAIYRVKISGTKVHAESTNVLTDRCQGSFGYVNYTDLVQPFIYGMHGTDTVVMGGNLWCYRRFASWNYARGGKPKRALPSAIAPPYSFGQTVSPPSAGEGAVKNYGT